MPLVIDSHTHIFPPQVIAQKEEFLARDAWFSQLYRKPTARMCTAQELIASMDEAGVDISVVCGFCWGNLKLARMSNDYLLEASQLYPGRLIPLANAPLSWGGSALRELERTLVAGAKGIGELMPDGQGYSLDDDKFLAPVVELAVGKDVPIMLHSTEPVGHHYAGKGGITPSAIERFVQRFPQVMLILAHWGGGLVFYELMPEVREELSRAYYDTAASPYLYSDEIFTMFARLVEDKLLFGSDFPLVDQGEFLARLRKLNLPEDRLTAILGGNARRLFRLP